MTNSSVISTPDGTEWEWQPDMASWTNDKGQSVTRQEMNDFQFIKASYRVADLHPAYADKMRRGILHHIQNLAGNVDGETLCPLCAGNLKFRYFGAFGGSIFYTCAGCEEDGEILP